jgi:hypothetical protein
MGDPQLMKLFDFDESELQANRNGRLSEKQKARLSADEKNQKGCSAILGGFLMLIALVGVGIAVAAIPAIINEDRGAAIAIGVVFGCIWPLVWGGIGFIQVRRAFVKMEVKVRKAEGPINIVKAIREDYNPSTKTHSEYSVYELRVGKRVFEVESEVADVMTQGDVYAVYYADINLDDSEDPVLSAELLEKGG